MVLSFLIRSIALILLCTHTSTYIYDPSMGVVPSTPPYSLPQQQQQHKKTRVVVVDVRYIVSQPIFQCNSSTSLPMT